MVAWLKCVPHSSGSRDSGSASGCRGLDVFLSSRSKSVDLVQASHNIALSSVIEVHGLGHSVPKYWKMLTHNIYEGFFVAYSEHFAINSSKSDVIVHPPHDNTFQDLSIKLELAHDAWPCLSSLSLVCFSSPDLCLNCS